MACTPLTPCLNTLTVDRTELLAFLRMGLTREVDGALVGPVPWRCGNQHRVYDGPPPEERGDKLSVNPQFPHRLCPICGLELVKPKSHQKYHPGACRHEADRRSLRERRRADPLQGPQTAPGVSNDAVRGVGAGGSEKSAPEGAQARTGAMAKPCARCGVGRRVRHRRKTSSYCRGCARMIANAAKGSTGDGQYAWTTGL